MKRIFSGALVAAVMVAAVPAADAAGFRAPFNYRVNPVNANVFEVIPRSSGSGPTIWCAAADYARRALGAAWTTQVYVARGRGPSVTTNRRSAVHFTITPQAAGVTPSGPSLSLNSFRVGDHMSVQAANLQCDQNPVRW